MVNIAGLGGTGISIIISAIDNFSRVFSRAKIGMMDMMGASIIFGAAISGLALGFTKAIRNSLDLETAMVGVRKTTNLSAEATEELRQDFIELSKVMPITAQDLAKVGEVAGQLGIEGRDNIREFTRVASMMGIATLLTAEEAALAFAKVSNAFNLPIKNVEKLGSAINELSNTSAANSREIVSALVRVAGSAETLGLSVENVTGMTAALIAAGEPAERAGTKLRSAFDQIVKKINEVSELMGTDFKKALEEDADSAILSLINRINEIESPVERQSAAIDIFGKVGASAINKLSNNLPEMNRLIGISGEQIQNATSLQEEYDLALESTANQIQLVKSRFEEIGFQIGDIFIPILRDRVLPFMLKVLDVWDMLGPTMQTAIIIGIVATGVVLALALAFIILSFAMSPLILTIILIALAIGLLVAMGVLLYKNWETIKKRAEPFVNFLKGVFTPQIVAIKIAIKILSLVFKAWWDNFVKPVWNKLKLFVNWLEDNVLPIIKIIGKFLSGVSKGIGGAANFVGGLFGIEEVNDFILRPDGKLLKTNPNDTIMGTKDPGGFGSGGVTIIINGNINGMTGKDIADALQDELDNMVRLN